MQSQGRMFPMQLVIALDVIAVAMRGDNLGNVPHIDSELRKVTPELGRTASTAAIDKGGHATGNQEDIATVAMRELRIDDEEMRRKLPGRGESRHECVSAR